MPRTPNPASMSKNWRAGMSQGAAKYKQGIADCQVNPMQLAAAKVADGTYLAAVTDAVNSGRMVNKLNAADPAMWKANASGAGASAWSASIAKGGPKYDAQVSKLAAAGAAASQAAAQATGPLAKVQASINAMKQAFGKSPI